jgi:acyl-CoA synthetase (AMP-forming)/AMP-acid ligase II
MLNLSVILRESAAARTDAPALLYDGGEMTYAELDMRSDAVAEALQAAGPWPGSAVRGAR